MPAILCCYGGQDLSRSSIRKGLYGGRDVSTIPTPVFTTRGFAVLMADAPLGPEGQPGQPIEELRDVILPQVYRAAELGYVDIGRVAVTGQSYGGYCTAALVSTTNLFRAAVAVSGKYDLAGNYGLRLYDNAEVLWSETGQGADGPTPLERPATLPRQLAVLPCRPYPRALLIIHGRDDNVCPVQEAERMFSALRRLGRTAQIAIYDGEGHVIFTWDRKSAVDAAERMLDFLRGIWERTGIRRLPVDRSMRFLADQLAAQEQDVDLPEVVLVHFLDESEPLVLVHDVSDRTAPAHGGDDLLALGEQVSVP